MDGPLLALDGNWQLGGVCRYRTAEEEVPVGHYTIPLGQARVVRSGTDVTIVTWGQQVGVAQQAVWFLARNGFSSLQSLPYCEWPCS